MFKMTQHVISFVALPKFGMVSTYLFCYGFQNKLLCTRITPLQNCNTINLPAVPAHDFKYKTPLVTTGKRIFLFDNDETASIHGDLGPVYTKRQSECTVNVAMTVNAVMTLVIQLSLKSRVTPEWVANLFWSDSICYRPRT